jgi:hypothetical protein
MNQELAHLLGAGFKEFVAILDYRYYIIVLNYKFNYAITSRDTSGFNFGDDIFKSDITASQAMDSFGN